MNSAGDMVVYVDVDDTLVRSFGSKRIPMAAMVQHVRDLHAAGVTLLVWSTAGADYARAAAVELGLEGCFQGFLPKPHVIIDDQAPSDWRDLIHVHPAEASAKTAEDYLAALTCR
jgi:cation transport ATPase